MNFGSPPIDMWLSRLAAEYLRGGHPLVDAVQVLGPPGNYPRPQSAGELGGGGGGEGREGGGEKKERLKRYLSIITVPILYKSTSEIRTPL